MIRSTVHDGVAVLEADDYSLLTAHDAAFARAMAGAVIDLSDEDSVKVIVVRASGADFAPEADAVPPSGFDEIVTTWDRDFASSRTVYQALAFSKKVTITQVSGACLGAGAMLVLATDLTVAGSDALIGSPFSTLPEANFVLASLTMRLNRAKAWLLRDTVLTADQAEDAGLVNYVVAPADISSFTDDLAQSVTDMPLDGVVISKMLLQAVMDGHGIGREFDMADLYANALWSPAGGSR